MAFIKTKNKKRINRFIGREWETAEYRRQFELSIDNVVYPIVSIYGIGGIGKSTLVREFMTYERDRTLYAKIDDFSDIGNDIKCMIKVLAENINLKGKPQQFPNLNKVQNILDKALEKIAGEGREGKDLLQHVLRAGQVIVPSGIGGALGTIFAGPVGTIGGTAFGNMVGEATGKLLKNLSSVSGKIFYRLTDEERDVLNEPVAALTNAFVKDLNETSRKTGYKVVIFFDAFEKIDTLVESWLLDYLIGRENKKIKADIRVIVSGRSKLGKDRRWHESPLCDNILFINLDCFNNDELCAFLTDRCPNMKVDKNTIIKIREVTYGGWPLLLERWISSGARLEGYDDRARDIRDAAEWIAKSFKNEQELRIVTLASCTRWYDVDILSTLFDNKQQAQQSWKFLVSDLSLSQPVNVEQGPKWAVHDIIRKIMQEYLEQQESGAVARIHERLAFFFQERIKEKRDQLPDLTVLYSNNMYMADVLEWLRYKLQGLNKKEAIQHWITTFIECLQHRSSLLTKIANLSDKLKSYKTTRSISKVLIQIASAYEKSDWDTYISALYQLLKLEYIENSSKNIIHSQIGKASLNINKYNKAVSEFSLAIENNPKFFEAFIGRGLAFTMLGDFKDALSNFNTAAKIKTQSSQLLAVKGYILRRLGRDKDALTELNNAIVIDENFAWALAIRGDVLRRLGRYEEGLSDVEIALKIDSNYNENEVISTEMIKNIERQNIDIFSAIEKTYWWALPVRGVIYEYMGRYEKAIEDLTKAFEINPWDSWTLWHLGETYFLLERTEEGKESWIRWFEIVRNSQLPMCYKVNANWFHFCCALAALIQNDFVTSKKHLEEAIKYVTCEIEKDPDNMDATLNLLLYLLVKRDKKENALKCCESLLHLLQRHPSRFIIDDALMWLKILKKVKPEIAEIDEIEQLLFRTIKRRY